MPLVLLALFALIAAPALAAGGGKDKAPGQNKVKVETAPITLNGTIDVTTNADGKRTYTLTDGGTTYELSAGPKWFFAAGKYPLDPYVGESVTIEGEIAEGSNEVEVISVNGTALRAPGKPPWADGWKAVGERHPGWSQAKADKFKAKFGDCFPPGQCKDKSGEPDDGDDDRESD